MQVFKWSILICQDLLLFRLATMILPSIQMACSQAWFKRIHSLINLNITNLWRLVLSLSSIRQLALCSTITRTELKSSTNFSLILKSTASMVKTIFLQHKLRVTWGTYLPDHLSSLLTRLNPYASKRSSSLPMVIWCCGKILARTSLPDLQQSSRLAASQLITDLLQRSNVMTMPVQDMAHWAWTAPWLEKLC